LSLQSDYLQTLKKETCRGCGIRGIFVRIRIRIRILGSAPRTNVSESGSGTLVHLYSSSKIKKSERSHETVEIKVFLLFLLDDGRIRRRIRTCDYNRSRMRIQEVQKQTDPTAPDLDADPDPNSVRNVRVRTWE
jgi:hypothetical protein